MGCARPDRIAVAAAVSDLHHKAYREQLGDAAAIGAGKSGVASLRKTVVPGKKERGT